MVSRPESPRLSSLGDFIKATAKKSKPYVTQTKPSAEHWLSGKKHAVIKKAIAEAEDNIPEFYAGDEPAFPWGDGTYGPMRVNWAAQHVRGMAADEVARTIRKYPLPNASTAPTSLFGVLIKGRVSRTFPSAPPWAVESIACLTVVRLYST